MGYFTNQDKDYFRDHGFVVKQDVVRPDLLEKAVDRFWDEIGLDRSDPGAWANGGPRGNLKVSNDPDVRSTLTDSPIQEMCEELVGADTLVVSNYTFAKPVYPTGRPASEWTHPAHGHLDGHGLTEGVVSSFTIGVTVNMNDVKPRSGGFTVWPGTHRRVHDYFRDHSLLNGLKAFQDEDGNYVDLPEPVENPGPPGTAIFWHHLMMHQAGNNYGEAIRMACVSRYKRKDTDDIQFEFPEDMWTYWEGL